MIYIRTHILANCSRNFVIRLCVGYQTVVGLVSDAQAPETGPV